MNMNMMMALCYRIVLVAKDAVRKFDNGEELSAAEAYVFNTLVVPALKENLEAVKRILDKEE